LSRASAVRQGEGEGSCNVSKKQDAAGPVNGKGVGYKFIRIVK
jgi:hypothetical protein